MRLTSALLFLFVLAHAGGGVSARELSPMVDIPGGSGLVGDDDTLPEEAPRRRVDVEGFRLEVTEVKTGQFRRFVEATGYVTVAERVPDPVDFPGADPELLVPGSIVFSPPPEGAAGGAVRGWWAWMPGANWRMPDGPDGEAADDALPVVHVAYDDAVAYADWAGGRLPTEDEWETAARGGLEGKRYTWGDEERPDGRILANHWQGEFPHRDDGKDGHAGLAPPGRFPPNGYGLYDMAGNVWEWTSSPWRADRGLKTPAEQDAFVLKGGSYLCAENYCFRYRPAARIRGARDTGTSHTGFRLAADASPVTP